MNDMKSMFGRILDAPPPATRSTAEVVATARRSARRRSAFIAAGSGLPIAAMAVLIAIIALAGARSPVRPATTAAPTESAAVAGMPALLTIVAHKADIGEAMAHAIAGPFTPGAPTVIPEWLPVIENHGMVTEIRMPVIRQSGLGELAAYYVPETAAVTAADMCTPSVAARVAAIAADVPDTCSVPIVGGTPIRATVGADSVTATRFVGGGFLVVVSRQGTLAAPPATGDQIASLAADPVMWPR